MPGTDISVSKHPQVRYAERLADEKVQGYQRVIRSARDARRGDAQHFGHLLCAVEMISAGDDGDIAFRFVPALADYPV